MSKALWDYDVRVRERNLRNGKLKPEEVRRYLEQLPDCADQAVVTDLRQPAIKHAEHADTTKEGDGSQGPASAAPQGGGEVQSGQ